MKKSNLKLQLGDLIQMKDLGLNSYYILIEKKENGEFECREIKRDTNHVIISGVCTVYVDEDLDKYNEYMYNNFMFGIHRVYRWKKCPGFQFSHGIIGNAYEMLTYGIDRFCIFNAEDEEED